MADYTLSAKGTYDGSNFDKGIKSSESTLAGFKNHCSAISVAVGNTLANVLGAGWNAVTSSMDAAISRVDALNQFPKVMKNLGYDSDMAANSVSRLSDGIDGLPTTLDEIVMNTQQLALSLGDLDKSTDVAIALNDGFLTFGASSEQVTSAITQLNQMITAGKYDMQSWNSINQAAPGFLDTVARSMMGAEAKASDLRSALNDGKYSSEDFLNAIIKLDKEGADGIVAFSQSAQDACGGIGTSMGNVKTAITKNLANIIDAVNGSGAISKFFDNIKGVINSVGKSVKPMAVEFGDFFASVMDGSNSTANSLMKLGSEFLDNIVPSVSHMVDVVKKAFGDLGPIIAAVAPFIKSVGEVIVQVADVFVSGIGSIISSVSNWVDGLNIAKGSSEGLRNAVDGTRDAITKSKGSMDEASSSAEDYSDSVESVTRSAKECLQSQANLAEKLSNTWNEFGTNSELARRYTDTIADLTQRYDENGQKAALNAEEQAQLIAAVSGLNDICGTTYSVIDAGTGTLDASTQAIQENTEAWILNAQAQAAQEAYGDLMKQQMENERELAKVTDELTNASEGFGLWLGDFPLVADEASQKYHDLTTKQAELQAAVDENSDAQEYYMKLIEDTNTQIQESARSSEEDANALNTISSRLEGTGVSTEEFVQKLQSVGVSITDIAGISDEAMAAMLESYSGGFANIIAVCDQYGIEIPESVRMAAEQATQNAAGAIEEGQQQVTEAMAGLVEGVDTEAQRLPVEVPPEAQNAVDQITESITNGAPVAQGAMAGLVEGVDLAASEMPGAVQPDAQEAADSVASAINSGAAAAASAMSGLVAGVEAESAQMPGEVNANAVESGNEIVAGLQSTQDSIVATADNISKLVADHFSSASTDAWFAGQNMAGKSFKEGIDSGRNAAVAAADTVSKQVADHFSSANGDAYNAGYNMAIGMANGIKAGQSAVVNAAVQVVQAANAAAKSAAAEHSPSKIWKEIGFNMPKGAANGISNGEDLMVKAARTAVQATNSVAKTLQFRIPMFEESPYATNMATSRGVATYGFGEDSGGIYVLCEEVADLKRSLGQIIADNAPVVVETERQAARRYRKAAYA